MTFDSSPPVNNPSMKYHKIDLSRFGYQRRKHRALVAATPENQEPAQSSQPTSTLPSNTSHSPAPDTAPQADVTPLLQSPPEPSVGAHIAPAPAPSIRAQNKVKRKQEEDRLNEEWRGLYWFKGMRMEPVLEDYGSSYDSHYNKRMSRRIAHRLLLTAG